MRFVDEFREPELISKAAEEIRGLWRWVWTSLTRESIDHGPTAIKATG